MRAPVWQDETNAQPILPAKLKSTQEDDQMDMLKISEQARALLDAHGDKAQAEAAQEAA